MKSLLILVAFIFSSSLVFSQAPVTADEKAEKIVQELKTKVSLTDDQIPKVKTIALERINNVTAAHKKYGADKNRITAANKLTLEEWETKLKTILTPEQFEKYQSSK